MAARPPGPPPPPERPSERGEAREALVAFGPAVVLAFVLEWSLTARAGWPRGRALLASVAVGIAIALSVQRALARGRSG